MCLCHIKNKIKAFCLVGGWMDGWMDG